MKAILHTRYAGPEHLQVITTPTPEPGETELLIKVHAATVNRTDCANLLAKPAIMRLFTGLLKPKKKTTGTDFAGEVLAKGSEVEDFNVGDRVFGFADAGVLSHATHMLIDRKKAMGLIPEGISFNEACASIEGTHYAYNAIRRMDVAPGQKILVNGATGAIGSAGLQILKTYGAEVTVTSNTKNIHLMQNLGADRVIDFTKEDFTECNEKFDGVFDAVGKSTLGAVKKILKPGGVYISSELGPGIQNVWFSLFPFLTGKYRVRFPYPDNIPRSIKLVQELLESKMFKAVIDRTYPLEQVPEAFQYVLTGEKTGNVVIEMDHSEN